MWAYCKDPFLQEAPIQQQQIPAMKKYLIVILLCISVRAAFAQEDSLTAKKDSVVTRYSPKSYFLVSLSYLSNSVFNGRKDSIATPYITPTIGFYDKSGFFINAALSYLARQGSDGIDLFNIEAGYDFSIGNFDGGIAANKSFYNSNSTNVKSEIKGSVTASAAYDFNFIEAMAEGGINFGDQADYTLGLGLEHTFYAAADKLHITPSALANASTQNYYGSYYAKRRYGSKRKKAAGITYEVFADVTDASHFKMLDYEFSLPVTYKAGKFIFSFTPTYVLPVNPATVTVKLVPSSGPTPAPKIFTEKLDNTFYFSFGVSYKLITSKTAKPIQQNL